MQVSDCELQDCLHLYTERVEEVPEVQERVGREALMKEPWMRKSWGTGELQCSGKQENQLE